MTSRSSLYAQSVTRNSVITAALGVVGVLLLGFAVRNWTGDIAVTQAFNSLNHGGFGALAGFLYATLEPPFAVLLTVLSSGLIWLSRGDYRRGLAFGSTVAATWLPIVGIKLLFERPRPTPLLLAHPSPFNPTDWSFASGHTAFIAAFFMALAVFLTGRRLRGLVVAACAVISTVVLISGLHYPTDIVASIVWGVSLVPLMSTLASRACSRLPELSGSGHAPSSVSGSGHTCRRSLPAHRR